MAIQDNLEWMEVADDFGLRRLFNELTKPLENLCYGSFLTSTKDHFTYTVPRSHKSKIFFVTVYSDEMKAIRKLVAFDKRLMMELEQ